MQLCHFTVDFGTVGIGATFGNCDTESHGFEGLVCLVLNIGGMGGAAMVPVVFLTFCMFRDDNARQRVTLIFEICKTSEMCFTLHIFRNIKVILIWN